MSLSWRLYWNLVSQKKPWMNKLLKESARNAPNRGFVFEFDEFRHLITTEWRASAPTGMNPSDALHC